MEGEEERVGAVDWMSTIEGRATNHRIGKDGGEGWQLPYGDGF